jgi:hypothetical protein
MNTTLVLNFHVGLNTVTREIKHGGVALPHLFYETLSLIDTLHQVSL